MDLKKYIRSVPDYPKKGILFRDITTLIKNKDAFKECIDQMSKILNTKCQTRNCKTHNITISKNIIS